MQENNPEVPVAPSQTDPIVKPIKVKKSFPVLTLLLILVLILSLAGTGYLAYQNMQLTKQIAEIKTSPTPVATVDPTADWKTYTNSFYNFQLRYPQNWTGPFCGYLS